MPDSNPPASPDEPPGDDSRIEKIVEEFVARLQSGEAGDLDKVLAEHPDLAAVLKRRLTFVENVFRAARSSHSHPTGHDPGSATTVSLPIRRQLPGLERAKHLDCPHCGNAIQIVEEESLEITCRVCGSTIHLDGEPTEGYRGPETAASFGRFAVLEVVGRGGFGVVIKARDTELNRIVALKVPRAGYFVSAEEEERFAREARNTARLRHPGIVPVLEVGRDHDLPYIVSEYIDGLTLADLMAERKLNYREGAELLATVCEAIDYAHRQKIIHRDIKPSNILLDHDYRPYVTDFGLARNDEGEFTVTMDGQVIGTPAYMSPEQASGAQHEVTPRSDVYSLGIVLYRLLCGELPFRGSRRMMLHQVMHEDPRVPRKINDYVPRDLETITLKAVAKEPAKRYPSAQAMADDLRRWLRGEPILARPVGRIERSVRWCRRNRLVAGLLALVYLLLLGLSVGAVWWAYRENNLRNDVQIARQRVTNQLARTTLNNGINQIRAGAYLRAMPWLVAALNLQADQPDRARVHRLRLGVLLDHSPRLTGVYAGDSPVTDAQYSSDGRRAVLGFDSGKVALVDAESGEALYERKHAEAVTDVAFSPSGDFFVTASHDHKAEVWRTATGQRLRSPLQHEGSVFRVDVSPDGKRIVTAGRDRRALIWNADTDGPPMMTLPHDSDVKWAEFSPDGQTLVTGQWKTSQQPCTVQAWDSNTGMPIGEPMVHPDIVDNATFSTDGTSLVTGCWDSHARIWQVATGRQTIPALPHDERVMAAAFSPDGKLVVTAAADGQIRSWIAGTGQPHQLLFQTGETLTGATFDPTGRFVATASWRGHARIWRLAGTRQIVAPLPHAAPLSGVQLAAAGRTSMSYDRNGVVKFWNHVTADVTTRRLRHGDEVTRLCFSASGRIVVSGGYDRVARIWNVATASQVGEDLSHKFSVLDVAISPNEQLVATGSTDKTARIWDARQGRAVCEPLVHEGWVLQVLFNPAGTKLLTSCHDGNARVWDVASGELDFQLPHLGPLTWIEYSADGKWIGTSSRDGTAKIWTANGRHVATLQHGETVMKCRFDHLAQRALTVSQDDTAALWRLPEGTRIGAPMRHRRSVWDGQFSHDGRFIVTSNSNGAATIWDAGELPRRLGEFAAFGPLVQRSTFDPSGQLVLTRSRRPATAGAGPRSPQGAAEVWDRETFDPVTPPLLHLTGDVSDAHFSPAADLVATAGTTGEIRLWRLRGDDRPIEALRSHAELLSGYRIDDAGNETVMEPDELVKRCAELRATSPSRFESTAAENEAWQRFVEATPPLSLEAFEPPEDK